MLLTIHRVAEEIAERMGKTPHPDPWRTLLAIGNAWLARVQDEGGPEAMARALTILEAQDREQAGKQAH